ncbi:MAG: glycerophosphodiester phosphodiesterase [Promethearchaeota archaeon]
MVDKICWGHRGAMGYEPGNTLLGFKTAIHMGVDGIELDVYKSRDGVMVVTHSDALAINGHRYRVSKLDIDEIKKVRLEKNQEIPTLQEVFLTVEKLKPDVLYSIDLKDVRDINEYADVITKHDLFDRAYTCMESRLFMKKAKRVCDKLMLVYSTHVGLEGHLDDLEKVKPEITAAINLPICEMTGDVLQSIKKAGFKAFVWDVNDEREMLKTVEMDVDGIYTNYPDKLLEILGRPVQSR